MDNKKQNVLFCFHLQLKRNLINSIPYIHHLLLATFCLKRQWHLHLAKKMYSDGCSCVVLWSSADVMALAADVAMQRWSRWWLQQRRTEVSVTCRFSFLPTGSLSWLLQQFDAILDLWLPSGLMRSLCLKLYWSFLHWHPYRTGWAGQLATFLWWALHTGMSLGMRPSSILHTFPSQRGCLWARMANMLDMPA